MSIIRIMRPKIIVFGDSITQLGFGDHGKNGWVSLLSAEYSRRADVLSRGYHGYNTRHALSILPSILKDYSPSSSSTSLPSEILFYTVFFGANDASLPTARQHLSIEEYGSNMRKMISIIRNNSNSKNGDNDIDNCTDADTNTGLSHIPPPIVLFTPPPCDPEAWDRYCTVTSPRPLSPRCNDNVRKYGREIIKIGSEFKNCPVIDTFELLGGDDRDSDGDGGNSNCKQYLTDGLHLTEEANTMIHKKLMDVLRKSYRHLYPMKDGEGKYGRVGVPLDGPLWSELC